MRPLLLLATPLILCACSSEPDPQALAGKLTDSFQTEIKSDGMKLFTYSIETIDRHRNQQQRRAMNDDRQQSPTGMPDRQRTRQPQDNMGNQQINRSSRRSDSENKQMTQELEFGLKKTLEANQYCRDGYYELERLVLNDRAELRGECHEGATDKDIQRFGYGKFTSQKTE